MKKQGYICLAFDDGNKTDLTVGLQEQLNRGMIPKGTSYIIGQYVAEWYQGSPKMNTDDCIEMLGYGWDLEDHSYSHAYEGGMQNMTTAELNQQLDLMDDLFQNTLHSYAPRHFSAPGGRISKHMLDVIGNRRETIMLGAAWFITTYTNRLAIPYFTFDDSDIDKIIDDTVNMGIAVMLFGHELSTTNSINNYKHVLDYGLEKGAQFIDMRDLMHLYNLKGVFDMKTGV